MVTILSIDGGGIRGVIPARVLSEIRRRLDSGGERRTFAELFDLVAGTSTGALIALGLSLRNGDGHEAYSAPDMVDLYERRGKEIFPFSVRSVIHAAVQIFRNKYPAAGFERVLRETFGDATMRDGATNLLITSFDTERMKPHWMKNRPRRAEWSEDRTYLMRDAARASAAAPTYFPPAFINPIGFPDERYSLIDGGVFANNPAGLAFVEATKIFPDEHDFLVLSLGTGEPRIGYPHFEIRNWGYMEWVNPAKGFPIGAIMSAGQSEVVNYQLKRMAGVRYLRVSGSLGSCSTAIDDAGRRNLDNLRALSDEIIAAHDAEIDEVCRALRARPASGASRNEPMPAMGPELEIP